MTETQLGFLIVCLVVGGLGALLGGWIQARSYRAQLDAQSDAFELARGKVNRDLQNVLLCVPQSMQQTMRLELELLGRQQAARWKEQFREQRQWQAEQDALRVTEWQVLLSGLQNRVGTSPAVIVPPVPARSAPTPARMPVPQPVPAPPPPLVRVPELPKTPQPRPAPVDIPDALEAPERELSDEEVDALPPDLPAPNRLSGRKLPAPKGPTLRNI